MIRLMIALCMFLAATSGGAEEIAGKVIAVADGDTMTVLRGMAQIKVRLIEIDAPDKAQAFANRSKQVSVQESSVLTRRGDAWPDIAGGGYGFRGSIDGGMRASQCRRTRRA